MKTPDIKRVSDQVEWALEIFERTRNCDIELMLEVWRNFYPEHVCYDGTEEMIFTSSLDHLPRLDHITRVRRMIQMDKGKFLPTDWKVAKARRIEMSVWKEYVLDNKYH